MQRNSLNELFKDATGVVISYDYWQFNILSFVFLQTFVSLQYENVEIYLRCCWEAKVLSITKQNDCFFFLPRWHWHTSPITTCDVSLRWKNRFFLPIAAPPLPHSRLDELHQDDWTMISTVERRLKFLSFFLHQMKTDFKRMKVKTSRNYNWFWKNAHKCPVIGRN